jgi:hypothetical protein
METAGSQLGMGGPMDIDIRMLYNDFLTWRAKLMRKVDANRLRMSYTFSNGNTINVMIERNNRLLLTYGVFNDK